MLSEFRILILSEIARTGSYLPDARFSTFPAPSVDTSPAFCLITELAFPANAFPASVPFLTATPILAGALMIPEDAAPNTWLCAKPCP